MKIDKSLSNDDSLPVYATKAKYLIIRKI